ncbi:MAG: Gfo/Idh/MocA family protein [bacterium]
MNHLGVGLIGLGRHGIRYARHLLDGVPEMSLVAVCRGDRAAGESFAREHGVRFHADWRELVADAAVDAVAVVTPHDVHAEPSIAAISAGKALLIEKPLAANAREGDSIARAAAACAGRGACVAVAQTLRYELGVAAFRDALAADGGPRAIHILLRGEDRNLGPDGRWRQKDNDGGALLDAGVHFFDLAAFLGLGRVRRVFARVAHALGYPVEDSFTAILETDACPVTIDVSRIGGARYELIEALTPAGVLQLDRFGAGLTRIRGRDREPVAYARDVATLPIFLTAFRDAALGRAPAPVSLDDGLRALRIADTCRESARSGAWIDFESH